MTNQNNNLLTVSEAIALLGISRATFDRWKKDKQLPYSKIGKEVFIYKDKLEQWMSTFDFSSSQSNISETAVNTIPIHIGYYNGSAQLWSSIVMKKLNLLEEQLDRHIPNKTFNIQWQEASNEIDLVQQFLANKLNLIAVGDYPIHISFKLSRLFSSFKPQLIALDGKSVSNHGIALVLQQDVQLEEGPLDIATVPSTSTSYQLQKLLKKRSQAYNAFAKPSMEHCMNSFLSHEVDAAMLSEPYLSVVEQLGAGKRLPLDDNTIYLTGILANTDWLADSLHKQMTTAYLSALLAAHHLLRDKDSAALKAIEEDTSLSLELIDYVISHIRYDAAVYQSDLKHMNTIFNDSAAFQLQNDIDSTVYSQPKIKFEPSYLNSAIKHLNLPSIPNHCLTGSWTELSY